MNDELFSVKGKNIILTGSSGLLGSVYAQSLLSRGANMALIDIKPKQSQKIKNEFKYLAYGITKDSYAIFSKYFDIWNRIKLESSPPDTKAPTGTSLISCLFIADSISISKFLT